MKKRIKNVSEVIMAEATAMRIITLALCMIVPFISAFLVSGTFSVSHILVFFASCILGLAVIPVNLFFRDTLSGGSYGDEVGVSVMVGLVQLVLLSMLSGCVFEYLGNLEFLVSSFLCFFGWFYVLAFETE